MLQAWSAAAQEETSQDRDRQYVTDQLRLSLYANPNGTGQIQLLRSGDLLEIEQVQGNYALVVTPEGKRGWVKRGFLVSKPTSNLLLAEEQRKTEALQAEIDKLGNSKVVIDQYEQDMNALAEQMQELEEARTEADEKILELEAEVEAKQLELERRESDGMPMLEVLTDTFLRFWTVIVPFLLVIVAVSFYVSKQIVESRIKARFHGIKIW
ncbi:MAG: hypothetical protein QNJ85_12465 [Gammaproteobacteria bacterium]|nr:hypothetical protein [Gammaproteobacteria bacterium]